MKFTYQGYADLISLLQEHDYTFTDYHRYKNLKKESLLIKSQVFFEDNFKNLI